MAACCAAEILKQQELLLGCFAAAVVVSAAVVHGGGLSSDYYKQSCPQLETIVKNSLLRVFVTDPRSPAAFLRLLFHDCQVQGCDASILLDSDSGRGIASEKASARNFGIRNRETIGELKEVVEAACPGQVVSCADIIALAAREAVVYSDGPWVAMPLGRKDSRVASNRRADAELPSPTVGVDGSLRIFLSQGLSIEDSVALLGAHALGAGHCVNIVHRLYKTKEQQEECMDYKFGAWLRLKCPTRVPITNDTFIFNDVTATLFDNQYYKDVMSGRGLFTVDSTMSTDPRTAPYVKLFADDQAYFFKVFSMAFIKLSSIGVLTGENDEIRKDCNRRH